MSFKHKLSHFLAVLVDVGVTYSTSTNYTTYSFARESADGRYVMFTSDMHGSLRSDVFLAEVPVR